MKKYNFNTINNLTTPEGWIEKALEIPQLEEKRRSEVRRRSVRYASLAASIVLVGALAVILFMNKGNQPPVVTAPMTSETVSYDFERSTQAPTHPATVAATAAPTVAAATAAQPTVAAARATAPTQPGTQGAAAPAPLDIYDEPTQPVIEPDISTQAPTQPPAPTQAPTQPPKDAPTEAPKDKLPDLAAVGYDGIIIEDISADELGDDSLICCRIYTRDGEPVGDGDSYSDEHLARRIDRGEEVTVYYIPCDYVVLPYNGVYRYEFYDETGRILCTGSEYLMTESIN
nr:hypothetical protein [uncultured Ruminococcus sp.]